ncbi:MAG: hypothetical protein COC01_04380 [Bacteroidetes bacterium]|nr:hypothetical protein [Bacteroidia bacterium]PCH68139.1 MAG: hypothetical protein COC01_04380 [Bacteroidota bacterium]
MKRAYNILSSIALLLFLVLLLLFGVNTIKAQELETEDDIYSTPIDKLLNLTLDKASVIGLPHPHAKGFFHIKYSRMIMPMTGFQEGTTTLSQDQVFNHPDNFSGYAPDMMMDMNMFMVMYGLNDLMTLMAMTNYSIIRMDSMVMLMGGSPMPMPMDPSKGIGDLKLMLNINAYNRDVTSVLFNIGVAIPTGSIDQQVMTMMNPRMVNKPYPMQLGSGTWDPKVEVVYLGSTMRSSWGVGLKSVLRMYDNKHGYHLGNRYQIMAGAGHNWAKWFATTARLDYVTWGNVRGKDETSIAIQPDWEQASPNHRADLRAGTRFEASAGLVFEVPKGTFKGVAAIFDYRYPIYQNLRGVGMPIDYHFQVALQWIVGEKHLKD